MRKIIAFAGLDGSGKTSQIVVVKKRLEKKGFRVKVFCHFTSPIGRKCCDIITISSNAYIRTLAFALDEYYQMIDNQLLTEYDVILCDRSHLCALVYAEVQGIPRSWIEEVYKFSWRFDMGIYLDVSITTSHKRKGLDFRSPKLTAEQFRRVRKNYLQLVEEGRMVLINAEQDFDQVTNEIVSHITKLFIEEE